MPATVEKKPFTLKLTRHQRADVRAAAALETQRRKDNVTESELAREILIPGVHAILRQHGRTPASAAA